MNPICLVVIIPVEAICARAASILCLSLPRSARTGPYNKSSAFGTQSLRVSCSRRLMAK